MTKQEHTPTPWRVGAEGYDKLEIYAARVGGCDFELMVMTVAQMRGYGCLKYHGDKQAFAEMEANAAHIVHCVNMHDELVESLREAMALFLSLNVTPEWIDEKMQLLTKVRADQ